MTKVQILQAYQSDIRRAIEILKEAGCSQIFLFDSLATGQVIHTSDIDLAVRGCPKGAFFHLFGKLVLELDHPVDLISLDSNDAFGYHLEKRGDLLRIA
jgi:predicted nucleotidyltransferase